MIDSRLRVDYNRIAPNYDRRFADGDQPAIAAALLALSRELGAGRLLEVGCGTGHWLSRLSPAAQKRHGLDLSPGMLVRARERAEHIDLVRGYAGRLPYVSASFDLIYCVNAIHHFDDPAAFIHQARRLLRPGGALVVVGMDPHTRQNAWYVYDYFEGTQQTDLRRFPSSGTILDWMAAAGFRHVSWGEVDWIHDPKVGRAVLDDPFLRKDACSQLALLDDNAYAAGLRRIEAALTRTEALGETLTFPSDITTIMLTGWLSATGQPMRGERV
jgi:ubiquinone/menaquinone biosynthesis C-methylase UbiE